MITIRNRLQAFNGNFHKYAEVANSFSKEFLSGEMTWFSMYSAKAIAVFDGDCSYYATLEPSEVRGDEEFVYLSFSTVVSEGVLHDVVSRAVAYAATRRDMENALAQLDFDFDCYLAETVSPELDGE